MQTFVATLLVVLFGVTFGQGTYKCDVTAPCGCSPARPTTTILSRIVGGEDAQEGSWPWSVSLRRNGDHLCGGTVIESRWILTAAHCFGPNEDLSNVTALAGSLTIEGTGSNVQERTIDRMIMHPNYYSGTNKNDIGLMRLSTPLNLIGVAVKRICLPRARPSLPRDNKTMVGIGWGLNSTTASDLPSILQQVTVRSINQRMFGCPSILYHPQQQFCAGLPQGGKDTCQGDSGGPLMSFRSGRWYVDGLTSDGIGCARPESPGLYTRVNFYPKWIRGTIRWNSD